MGSVFNSGKIFFEIIEFKNLFYSIKIRSVQIQGGDENSSAWCNSHMKASSWYYQLLLVANQADMFLTFLLPWALVRFKKMKRIMN
jgi:hypothetical protein